jgi:hypothetical protein
VSADVISFGFRGNQQLSQAHNMQQALFRMKEAVSEWLTKEGWLGDAEFYSVQQWQERKEEFLTDSLLILVIDGSTLHTMLNFGGDHEEFDDLVQSFGFFYELGNHWNLGFYPIDGYDFTPRSGDYSSKLRDSRWQQKAARVKRLAGDHCQDCGTAGPLEAHHCYYAAMRHGYQPWEYPLSAFRALCRTCHETRAQAEIRMRSFMASLTQSDMERLREGLSHALAFYTEDAFLTFLKELGPLDRHRDHAVAQLKGGLRDDW